jgi:hypothetical protein
MIDAMRGIIPESEMTFAGGFGSQQNTVFPIPDKNSQTRR